MTREVDPKVVYMAIGFIETDAGNTPVVSGIFTDKGKAVDVARRSRNHVVVPMELDLDCTQISDYLVMDPDTGLTRLSTGHAVSKLDS